jgi:lipase ATG15
MSSSSCEHPGWWGCHDPTTTRHPTPSPTSSQTRATKTPEPHTCETPGLFFGCHDRSSRHTSPADVSTSPTTEVITGAPSATVSVSSEQPTSTKAGHGGKKKKHKRCKHPALFGLICLDGYEEVEIPEL